MEISKIKEFKFQVSEFVDNKISIKIITISSDNKFKAISKIKDMFPEPNYYTKLL